MSQWQDGGGDSCGVSDSGIDSDIGGGMAVSLEVPVEVMATVTVAVAAPVPVHKQHHR